VQKQQKGQGSIQSYEKSSRATQYATIVIESVSIMFASKMAQRALIYRPFSSARTVSRHLGVLNTSTSRWQSSSAARESNLEEVVEQHNDHIKTAVKELLQNKESSSKAITFEQLQQSHQNFEVRDAPPSIISSAHRYSSYERNP
jgi:hypothetical protein